MKNIKYLIAILFSTFIWYSCSSDEHGDESVDASKGVNFTSVVEGDSNPMARAIGSSWTADDRIGIFMKKEGQALSATSVVNTASNVQFLTADGSGIFTPVNDKILYPADGSKVDFIAYYPFTSEITDYIYKVDVSNQTDQEAIDLLYSDNLKGRSKDNAQAELTFKHLLSKITFSFTKGTNVKSLLGLKVSILGLPTLADLELATGIIKTDAQSVDAIEVSTYNDGQNGEAIVLPIGLKTINVEFVLGSNSFTYKIENLDLKPNSKHHYNVTINTSGGEVSPTPDYAMWNETPLFMPKEGLQYVSHGMSGSMTTRNANIGVRNFSMLYDTENRVALWVAYPLHKGHMGSVKRTEAWQYDGSIAEFDQPNLKKSWPSYPMYNRGHQIASSDRTASAAANRMTFYYSNMTLQQVEFNGGTWERLEQQVQGWAGAGASDTVYVVTGVILTTPAKPTIERLPDNSSPAKMAAVPQYFYKALAKKSGNKYYTIGYRLPNVKPASGDKFYNYKTSVAELEKETGYTFFPNLDTDNKAVVDDSKWQITVK